MSRSRAPKVVEEELVAITEEEWEVMEMLWEQAPRTSPEITAGWRKNAAGSGPR